MTELYSGIKKDRELEIARMNILQEQAQQEKEAQYNPDLISESYIDTFHATVKRDKNMYHKLSDKLDLKSGLVESVFIDMLVESYFQTLEIDQFIKETEEFQIKENAKVFFEELVKHNTMNGVYVVCESNTIRELLNIIEGAAEEVANDAVENDDDDFGSNKDKVKSKTNSNSIVRSSMKSISNIIKNKVKETLDTEKEIAERNKEIEDELMEQGKKYHNLKTDVSLFRSIYQNTTTGSLNESENVNVEYVFTESVLQYTLIEYANTFRLVDFNPLKVKELARAYRHV